VREHPTLDVAPNEREMACALIEEEVAEFRAAVEASDLVEIADAVADLIWVVLEAGVTFGIPIEEVFAEVRRSNLTKIESGEPVVNAAGKIVAGPGFSPPDLLPILAAHAHSPEDVADWVRRRSE
jgi:NTP pyrophosphatase (non-canonical NTP hydrolase)